MKKICGFTCADSFGSSATSRIASSGYDSSTLKVAVSIALAG
jgi:hypothetical protein